MSIGERQRRLDPPRYEDPFRDNGAVSAAAICRKPWRVRVGLATGLVGGGDLIGAGAACSPWRDSVRH